MDTIRDQAVSPAMKVVRPLASRNARRSALTESGQAVPVVAVAVAPPGATTMRLVPASRLRPRLGTGQGSRDLATRRIRHERSPTGGTAAKASLHLDVRLPREGVFGIRANSIQLPMS